MNRKIVLFGSAAASLVLFGSLGGCAGLPWDCPLPVPEPAPRDRPAFQNLTQSLSPDLRNFIDRAVKAGVSRNLHRTTDWLIFAALLRKTYDHPGLRDAVWSGYRWLLYHPDGRNPNLLRVVHEGHARRDPLCAAGSDEGVCGFALSLYCDQVDPPPGFLENLRAGALHDLDRAVLVLFALTELRDRGCLDPAGVVAAIDEVAPRLAAGASASVRNGSAPLPAAVLALIFSGRTDLVRPEWISSLQARLRAETASGAPEPEDPLMLAATLVLTPHAPADPNWAPPPRASAPPPDFVAEGQAVAPRPAGGAP